MDISQIAESTSSGKMSSVVATIVLAGFLWVGKTTFEHVGQITGVRHELDTVHGDYNLLRQQYDEVLTMLNERTKSRFTREDSEKITAYIKEVEGRQSALKDAFLRDFTSLKVEIASLETNHHATPTAPVAAATSSLAAEQNVRILEERIASLQASLARLQSQVSLARGNVIAARPTLDPVPVAKR